MVLLLLGLGAATAGEAKPNQEEARFLRDLRSRNPVVLERALRELSSHDFDEWYDGQPLTAALTRLVRRQDAPGKLRILAANILRSLERSGPVQGTLRKLTFDPNEEVAREAADLLLYPPFNGKDGRPVEEALLSGPPIVREEAAIVIGEFCFHNVQPKTHLEAEAALKRMALDQEADPIERGRAIEALSCYVEKDATLDFLLDLLKPKYWFFGVAGNHYPVHSTASVLRTLNWSRRRDLGPRVHFFKQLVAQIPAEQCRWDTEVHLRIFFQDHPDETEEGARAPKSEPREVPQGG